ncbi:hypothetical protein RGL65_002235 [Vibrio parahaemolyticus]|nr:NAD-dependent protein deacylase [Vibrio parahaemolyticus]ELA8198204.1 hypothetical protein [Vibrio parahaemolyticus]
MKKAVISLNDNEIEISNSDRVLFITGAGISVASGLPTYRGEGGLYTNQKGKIEHLLSAFNMDKRPGVIWDVISPLLKGYESYKPNIAHTQIAQIQKLVKDSCVFTQQVDNLHQKAGSENVIDIHGNLSVVYCKNCINVRGIKNGYIPISDIDLNVKTKRNAPACSFCKSDLRPNIVPFNGMLDMEKIYQLEDFLREPVSHVFVIGTSLQFPYMEEPIRGCHKAYNAKIIYVEPSDAFDVLSQTNIPHYRAKMTSSQFFENCLRFE